MSRRSRKPANELESLFASPGLARPRGVVATIDSGQAPFAVQQADVLYLPTDDSLPGQPWRYALTVVDIATRQCDARPLHARSADEVLQALKDIWRGPYLRQPPLGGRLETDAGKEFAGPVAAFLSSAGIQHRVAMPGRHKQQGLVEGGVNKILGRAIHMRQAERELATGNDHYEWVEELPDLVRALNSAWAAKLRKKPVSALVKHPDNISDAELAPHIGPGESMLLPLGTEVRVRLDAPEDMKGRRLPARQSASGFAAGDIRWSRQLFTVSGNIILPGQSPRYLVSDRIAAGRNSAGHQNERVSYARHELQVIGQAQKTPPERTPASMLLPAYKHADPAPARPSRREPAPRAQTATPRVESTESRAESPVLPRETRRGRAVRLPARYRDFSQD